MIRIVLHEPEERILSIKESKAMVESYWHFCHGECCGTDVPYDMKEICFCHLHEEYDSESLTEGTVEWIWEVSFCGMVVN